MTPPKHEGFKDYDWCILAVFGLAFLGAVLGNLWVGLLVLLAALLGFAAANLRVMDDPIGYVSSLPGVTVLRDEEETKKE